MQKSVSQAIEHLDPQNERHQATYQAIMARNRPQEEAVVEFDVDGSGNNTANARVSPRQPEARYNALAGEGREENLLNGQNGV